MKEIINLLRDNSRMTLTDISTTVGMPITTLHEKIKRYCSDGVMRRHVSIIDFDKVGYPIKAIFVFQGPKKDLDLFLKSRNVNNLYRTDKGFIVEFIFNDLFSYMQHKDELELCGNEFEEHFIVEEIKKERANIE